MKRLLSITLISICLSSCIEWFDPDINPQDSMLVVEGLITDREGDHLIKISRSLNYNQEFKFIPERSALVYITDENDDITYFTEVSPGHYSSPSTFSGTIGSKYLLTISTEDGGLYNSLPQEMASPIVVDSLDAIFGVKEILIPTDGGGFIIQKEEGVNLFAYVNSNTQEPPTIRFQPMILVQYILSEVSQGPMFDPTYFFCRIKRPIDDNVNISIPHFGVDIGQSIYHNVGFVKKSFSIPTVDTLFLKEIDRRIVILRQYTLNQEAYLFYKELKNQISSEGSLFDPMASQLKGNLHCISDPQEKVMGFFEVSSYHTETFLLSPEPLNPNNLWIKRIHDLDFLPEYEEHRDVIPKHWIFL